MSERGGSIPEGPPTFYPDGWTPSADPTPSPTTANSARVTFWTAAQLCGQCGRPHPSDVLLALAADVRRSCERSMARDQKWAARVRRFHPLLSRRFKANFRKRGHGYAAALSIAAQIEKRAERWPS